MVKVSVVIPVYNVENYLEECLESIINQTLKDIEIICINDGSTDNSLSILNEYAKKDNRIHVISQENQGQAVARNNGMKYINGEYFCFMDADDLLDLNTLEECLKVSEEKSLDFVMYKLINFDDYDNEFYTTPGYDMQLVANTVKNNVFNYKTLGELIFYVTVSPVNKLFNTKFILDNDIRFPEGTVFEDNIFFWRMFFNANKCYFIQEHYYKRRRHATSTTGDGNERWVDAIEIYNKVWDIFKEFGLFDQYKSRLYNNKIDFALFRLDNIKEEYKELFFQSWKTDLLYIQDYFIDFNEKLNEKNKLMLKIVLTANNYAEFTLMRNLYTKNEKIKEIETKLNDSAEKISTIIGYNSDILQELYETREMYEKEKNSTLPLRKQIRDLTIKNQKYKEEIEILTKELEELKEYKILTEQMLDSNSWKMTKPFRKMKKSLNK